MTKRNSHIGFRKPNSKIGVSKTKTEHRGMKNEFQQVGYWKRKLIGGVSETIFKVWGAENENSKQGYNDPIQGRGVAETRV